MDYFRENFNAVSINYKVLCFLNYFDTLLIIAFEEKCTGKFLNN